MSTTINTAWKEHLVPDLSAFKSKRVLIRVDWNLPVTDGVVTDSTRLDVTVSFLQKLAFAGAKIIIMSHFGEKGESIVPVAKYAHEKLAGLSFTQSLSFDELIPLTHTIVEGEMLLLENVRLFPGETDNDEVLAKNFASLGDLYINDAFSVSHRKHASLVGVGELMLSYIGPTFANELEHLTKALTPEKPALLIVGGAKISTKLDLIKRYLEEEVREDRELMSQRKAPAVSSPLQVRQ
jgi:phosphoglycerate kinase